MADDADLAPEGSVLFSVTSRLPHWPSTCVVCGVACSETTELHSVARADSGTRFAHDVRGTRSFPVPVHATVKDCRSKLLHPTPIWAYLPPILFGLGVGSFMGYIAKPDWNDRMGAFTIFGAIAVFIGWAPMLVAFSPALKIRELGGADYIADFKDQHNALLFVALNRDIVRQIPRPSWDIDLFSTHKK